MSEFSKNLGTIVFPVWVHQELHDWKKCRKPQPLLTGNTTIFVIFRCKCWTVNPVPVDMVNIPLFTGFYTSQVVHDFLHQQYVSRQPKGDCTRNVQRHGPTICTSHALARSFSDLKLGKSWGSNYISIIIMIIGAAALHVCIPARAMFTSSLSNDM